MAPLRILFVTSEVAPYAKVGGLADVSAALPRQLHRLGHDVKLFVPLYRRVREGEVALTPVENLQHGVVRIGLRSYSFSILKAKLPGSELDVNFVDCPALYDRQGIYTQDGDEHVRFLLLTRAAIESCQRLQWSPDIAHWNDWPAAMGPLYLKSTYSWDKLFEPTRSVFTIHNLGHQGVFGAGVASDLSLGESQHLLHQEDLREGRVSFMKTALVYSDALTTVSPTYARQIQTEAFGMGLDGILRSRTNVFFGILNGIDDEEWNPRTDPLIAARYSEKSIWRKEKNKEALLTSVGLPYDKGAPVIGLVSRLSAQKGIELLDPTLFDLLRDRDARFVALGSGEPRFEELLYRIQLTHPSKAVFWRGYNHELAHRIEAGADLFLMPSLYEPCGLNQMYSLAYGTVPVVRNTGGLADTVEQFDSASGSGTGVVFEHYTADGLRWALGRALDLHADRKAWARLQRNGMSRDFSWSKQAAEYVDLYRRVAARAEARA
jgi:starch synthase